MQRRPFVRHDLQRRRTLPVVDRDDAPADNPLAPWRFSPIVWRARWAARLPTGTIAATGTERSDLVALEADEAPAADQDKQASRDEAGSVGEGDPLAAVGAEHDDGRGQATQGDTAEQRR